MPNIVTEQEASDAAKEMLKSAISSFRNSGRKIDDMRGDEIAKSVLKAIAAAEKERKLIEKRIFEASGADKKDYALISCDAIQIAATAFWCVTEEICDILDNIDDVAPNSVAGYRLVAFAQGIAASKALSDFISLTDDEEWISLFADGAELFVEIDKK